MHSGKLIIIITIIIIIIIDLDALYQSYGLRLSGIHLHNCGITQQHSVYIGMPLLCSTSSIFIMSL